MKNALTFCKGGDVEPLPTFTGTRVNYYVVCKHKLWLFTRNIEMERENENVQKVALVEDLFEAFQILRSHL